MNDLAPLRIIELQRGIRATFPDGHTADLGFDGKTCTCDSGRPGFFCPHIVAALPAFKAWKWRKVDADQNYQNPRFLTSIGIDPLIFNPPPVDWTREDPDAYLVWRRLWSRQHGWLFQFHDGAFFALLDEHPDAGTKCSLCRSRDCKHVHEALAQLRQEREQVHV